MKTVPLLVLASFLALAGCSANDSTRGAQSLAAPSPAEQGLDPNASGNGDVDGPQNHADEAEVTESHGASRNQSFSRFQKDDVVVSNTNSAKGPKFLDLARNPDGTVKYMSLEDAVRYCAAQGAHLPTIRELAMEAQARGAAGILEESQVDPNNVPPGYRFVIFRKDPTKPARPGNFDSFYFKRDGYDRPDGDLGRVGYWSSSVYGGAFDESSNGLTVYYLSGTFGDLNFGHSRLSDAYYSAVLCASSR